MLALAGASDTALEIGARLAAAAFVALVAALVLGWTSLVPASLVLLGAAYAVQLQVDDVALDMKAPLFGAGVVLVAELGYWSLEERDRVRADPGEDLRRLGIVALLALAGLIAGGALLALADLAQTRGLAVDLLGAVAAAAALLVVFLAARRPEER